MEDAPSDLAVLGRYILTPKIFDVLEQTSRGAGGEIQLTDGDQGPDRRAAGLRLPVRGGAARRGHPARMAEGEHRGRPRVRPRRRVSLLCAQSRPARLTPVEMIGRLISGRYRVIAPSARAAWPRLARHRRAARPRGRHQAAPPDVRRRPGIRRTLQAGGPLRRQPLPPEHRRRLRLGPVTPGDRTSSWSSSRAPTSTRC